MGRPAALVSTEHAELTPTREYGPEQAAIISEYTGRNLLHVIVNPVAGSGKAGKRWPELNTALAEHGFETVAHFTTRPGEATSIARRLAEEDASTIVCVGGDGTLNEIINGLVHDDQPVNRNTRLALIPAGTGKDFCRALGVETVEKALRALDADVTATIDLGRMTYIDQHTGEPTVRYFANCADGGLGAEAAARINASTKKLGAVGTYVIGAVRSILAFSFRDATYEVEGEVVFDGRSGMVVFANGPTFAGGMRVAPDASLCDGLFDIYVLQDVGKRALLFSLLPRVYRGRHVGRPGVLHTRGAHAKVTSPVELLVELDGEQLGRAPFEARVVPGVLRVIGDEQALQKVGGCTNPAL